MRASSVEQGKPGTGKTAKMTQKKQKEVRKALENAINTFDQRHPKLSAEAQEAIRDGVHSGSEDLRKLACDLAIMAVLQHYVRKTTPQYLDHHLTEKEDISQEISLAVLENIEKYNGIHSLFTFLDPIITAALMNAKNRGRGGTMTKFYMDANIHVVQAIRELRDKGFDNPSVHDIRDYLRIKKNKIIAETTIENIRARSVSHVPLDDAIMQHPAREDTDPQTALLEKEKKTEFNKGLTKLASRHKKLIDFELYYIDLHADLPTINEVYERFRDELVDFSRDDAERLQKAAHRELKSLYIKEANKEAPINKSISSARVRKELQQMEDDIHAFELAELTESDQYESRHIVLDNSALAIEFVSKNTYEKDRVKQG